MSFEPSSVLPVWCCSTLTAFLGLMTQGFGTAAALVAAVAVLGVVAIANHAGEDAEEALPRHGLRRMRAARPAFRGPR